MEIYKPVLNIYRLIERVKKNKELCPHVYQRLQALEKLALFIEQEETHLLPPDVKEALEKLNVVLTTAEGLIKRFNDAHALNQMFKSTDYREEFDNLNKSLSDSFVTLSAALHIYQRQKLYEQEEKLAEQERKLAEHGNRLEEQEDILQRVEANLANEMKGFYCILQ